MGFWTGLSDSLNNHGQEQIDRERRDLDNARKRFGDDTLTSEQKRNMEMHERQLEKKQAALNRAKAATEEYKRRER